jgi:ribosomal protein S18 acetylase RimI-like enzyme
MQTTIRNAHPDDADIIAAFNNAMAEETEGKSLDPGLIGPGVQQLLEDPTKGRYWVAETAGEIVGQILVTYEWSDWRDGMIWWIQSVYVVPGCRRQGVFSALYRHVESVAMTESRVCGIRLYVEKDNKRAQQTYDALGMVETDYRIMEVMLDRTRHPGDQEC